MTEQAHPTDVMAKLDGFADELNGLSANLAEVQRRLEPVQSEYQEFVDDFEVGLWEAHVNDDAKLPSAAMRLKLAQRAMKPELLGQWVALTKKRDRMMQRIRDLKVEVNAQQSILSALKEEMNASGFRRAA